MKKMLGCLKGSWLFTVLAPLFMGLEVFCDLQQPFLMARIINQGVMAKDMAVVLDSGERMVIMAVLGLIGGVGCSFFSTLASHGFALKLRQLVFGKIQTFALANLQKFGTSSLLTRLGNDTGMLQQVLTMMLQMMIRAPLLFIGGIIMALQIKAQLTVVLLVAIPALAIFLAIFVSKGFARFNAVQSALDRTTGMIQEDLRGIRVVKSFVRAPFQKERFAKTNEELVETTIKASRLMTWMTPVISLVMTLSIAAVLAMGGDLSMRGDLAIGSLMSLIAYISQILGSLMMLSMMFTVFSRAKASWDRVMEVLNEEPSVVDRQETVVAVPEPSHAPSLADRPRTRPHLASRQGMHLEFRNVSFRHPLSSGEPALSDVSFVLEPGQRLAVMGATGSGKSSLVNLIPRLYDPTQGQILMDGMDIRDYSLSRLRSRVGFASQRSVLFSGTIQDNLRWGRFDAPEEDVAEAAAIAQADQFIRQQPQGYQAILGQGGVNLSGGQRQRLSIARALVRKPRLLILDDATSALDTATEARLLEGLEAWRDRVSVIQIAQRISSVKDADCILILEDGRVVAQGSHEELLETSPAYREIYDSQKEGRVHG